VTGEQGTPEIAYENGNAIDKDLSAAFERLIMVSRKSRSQPYCDDSPHSSRLESVVYCICG
jgi:hypothetical protein